MQFSIVRIDLAKHVVQVQGGDEISKAAPRNSLGVINSSIR